MSMRHVINIVWLEKPAKGDTTTQFEVDPSRNDLTLDQMWDEAEAAAVDPFYPFCVGSTWARADGDGRYRVVSIGVARK